MEKRSETQRKDMGGGGTRWKWGYKKMVEKNGKKNRRLWRKDYKKTESGKEEGGRIFFIWEKKDEANKGFFFFF